MYRTLQNRKYRERQIERERERERVNSP